MANGNGTLGKTLLGAGGGAGGTGLLIFVLMSTGVLGGGTTAAESDAELAAIHVERVQVQRHMGNDAIHASSEARDHDLDRALGPVLESLRELKTAMADQDDKLDAISTAVAHNAGAQSMSLGGD